LVEISYVPTTRQGICQTVALRGEQLVAVWEDTKFFWSPAESCQRKYKIGERFHFPLSDNYSESDFYKIHMAVKQGLKLKRSLIPWMGDLS
jgi:hypothetical protein